MAAARNAAPIASHAEDEQGDELLVALARKGEQAAANDFEELSNFDRSR